VHIAEFHQLIAMPKRAIQKLKRSLSDHQKRIRFFTGFFLFIIAAVTFLIYWFANRNIAPY